MNYKEIFDEEMIEKVYLYSYKKLQNKADAEDLAQDILLEALMELHKNKEIHSFYSWFWRLAHNRYCVFLSKRNKTPYTVSIEGGLTVGTSEEDFSVDETLLMKEEISELNYVLSRLSAQHREMVIMFYLKEIKISEIANKLKIPEGTVKRRLFDVKTNLKKGLKNMNNVGKSAYAPADLQKWGGFGMPNHWAKLEDLILDQVFIACRNEAKTLNEIADEIGIAPVYIEDKIKYPLEHKFLKKDPKGRFLTDFCILPAQVNYDINCRVYEIYKDFGAELTEILYKKKDSILAFDFYGNKFDYNYLMWILYVFVCDRFKSMALEKNEKNWEGKVAKNNGKDYRIAANFTLANEKINYDKEIKSTGWSNLHEHFENEKYGKITYVNFFQSEPFSDRDGLINASNCALLFKLAECGGDVTLNSIEKEQAAFFISKGVIVKDGEKLRTNIPIMTYAIDDKIRQWFSDLLLPLVEKYVETVSKAADEIVLPHIRKDLLEEYAHWILGGYFFPLSYVFHWAIYEGKTLAIPEDYAKSAAGLYLKTR